MEGTLPEDLPVKGKTDGRRVGRDMDYRRDFYFLKSVARGEHDDTLFHWQ